jgi:hypothetical protein
MKRMMRKVIIGKQEFKNRIVLEEEKSWEGKTDME